MPTIRKKHGRDGEKSRRKEGRRVARYKLPAANPWIVDPRYEDPFPDIDWAPLVWKCPYCTARFSERVDMELDTKVQLHLREIHLTTGDIPPSRGLKQPKTKANGRTITPSIRWRIMKRDGFKCKKCGKSQEQEQLEIDHITPRSKGGASDPENLLTLCFTCNRGKGDGA